MSPSALHRCPYCGHEADVSGVLEEFSKEPFCRQCGLSDSEGSLKMQDDLASLFMRQMSMEGVHQASMTLPPTPQPTQDVPPIVYSITQHYHHSSHIANPNPLLQAQQNGTQPVIEPGVPAEETLMRHNIDPSTLFPSQLTLFRQAGIEQQSRLITLWQISPPGHSAQQSQTAQPMRDDSMEEDTAAEPYVISGYESLAQREYDMNAQNQQQQPIEPSTGTPYKPSNDPAYQSREWWNYYPQQPEQQQQQQQQQQSSMENQYGAFEQHMNRFTNCGLAQARGHWMEDEHML
ncbi:hypothetical protein FQN54_000667 [Arachnomyces sp. PD_36]|nr:hypothetical protein FQN54_000667 [Arachnomyces sp. PD_36]